MQLQHDSTNTDNLILATDSYKLNHWAQYPKGTETVYSYFESREGAAHPYTVFFGLQYLLKRYLARGVAWDNIQEAGALAFPHFGNNTRFNTSGWSELMTKHGGKLPLRIKAVPEGTVVPTGNVLMTVENTDPKFYWLTNYMESLLSHVWYPTTVATRSRAVKEMQKRYLLETGNQDSLASLPFMLHDFGYRGASSHESAGIGVAAHLVNYVGVDTLVGMQFAKKYYDADYETLGFSVPATEHSIMTAMGPDGEHSIVDTLLDDYPDGILSVVADSYNTYQFVNWLCSDFKERILARDGVFVVRPDSVTAEHRTPEDLVVWIVTTLWKRFGGTTNAKGYRTLDPHVRILWGDGIDPDGIEKILKALAFNSFAAENMAAFGMGGGLLQKVNRDTERFAFKSSAQKRNGEWHDVFKITPNKSSKRGRLKLSRTTDGYETAQTWVPPHDHVVDDNVLETVFENGKIVKEYTFDEVRANAAV